MEHQTQTTEPYFIVMQRRRPEFQKAYRSMPKELRDEADALAARASASNRANIRVEIGQVYVEGGGDKVRSRIAEYSSMFDKSPHFTAAGRIDWVRQQAERKEKREQEDKARKQARRAAWEAKRAEAMAALARGEPIPAMYRPVGEYCFFCRRALRDTESVRLGLGPDCLQQVKAELRMDALA